MYNNVKIIHYTRTKDKGGKETMKGKKIVSSIGKTGKEIFRYLNAFRKKKVKKCKKFLKERTVPSIKKAIQKEHRKSSWLDITVLLTNMMTLTAWWTMDLIQAEYEKKEPIYWFSLIATIIVAFVLIWQLICLVDYKGWKKLGRWIINRPKAIICWLRTLPPKIRMPLTCGTLFVLLVGCRLYFFPIDSGCYTSIQEINGIPEGMGKIESKLILENRVGYWHIYNYPFQKRKVLIYEEPYGQLELMREYSTFYERELFQPTAKIEVKYRKGEEDT